MESPRAPSFIVLLSLFSSVVLSQRRLPATPSRTFHSRSGKEFRPCVPAGRALLATTQVQSCPCSADISLALPADVADSSYSFDFLVVSEPQLPHISVERPNDVQFIRNLSRLNVTLATSTSDTSGPRVRTYSTALPTGQYALVLRSKFPIQNCNLHASISFHSNEVRCPIILSSNRGKRAPRIVGGTAPTDYIRAHLVAFRQNDEFMCSGSLISEKWAITAAHCHIDDGMIASVGGSTAAGGTSVGIRRVYPHPEFKDDVNNPYDIAVVELQTRVPSSSRFVRINVNDSYPSAGAFARASGYGVLFEGFPSSTEELLMVDVPIVRTDSCNEIYNRVNPFAGYDINDQMHVCAGYIDGGCDSCQGDSGGPLSTFDEDGNVVQIGVVSFGIGCARPSIPGVYAKLSALEPWIAKTGAVYTRATS